MLAVLKSDDALYQVVYLLHIGTMVAAFAGAIVGPRLAALARTGDPALQGRVAAFMAEGTKLVHFPALLLAGLLGIVLILLSDDVYEMSQSWISIAFVLWFAMLGVQWFLLRPAQLAAAGGDAAAGKKIGMFTGILHLLFLLMLIDMVWKPGV